MAAVANAVVVSTKRTMRAIDMVAADTPMSTLHDRGSAAPIPYYFKNNTSIINPEYMRQATTPPLSSSRTGPKDTAPRETVARPPPAAIWVENTFTWAQ